MRRRIPWLILVISLAWTGTWAEETYQVRKSGGQLVLTNVTPVGKAGRRTVAQQAAPVAEPAPAASPPRQRPYSHLVQRIASRYGVDANLVHAIIKVESNYDPRAVSRRGAVGLMQLLPSTAAEMGIYQLTDAHDNIMGNCVSCHNTVDAVGKSPAHISTTAICEDCHSVVAWLPPERMPAR